MGFLEGGGGVAAIEVLEIKGPGAESDVLFTVVFDDIDNDVMKNEIFERFKIARESVIIFGSVGLEDGGAEFGHFEVVDPEQSCIDKE